MEIQPIQHHPRTSWIVKRHIAEFKSANDWPGRGQGIRLRLNRRLHIKKRQQVCQEESLVRDTGDGRENLLDVAAGLKNRAGQQIPETNRVSPGDCPPDDKNVGRVIAHERDHGKKRARD